VVTADSTARNSRRLLRVAESTKAKESDVIDEGGAETVLCFGLVDVVVMAVVNLLFLELR